MNGPIDLGDYRTTGVRVFAGRERGREVRRAAGLARYDKSDHQVTVHVPEDVFSVNSSFFLAMFGDSIRALGEDGFRHKYHFTGKDISRVVNDSIRGALTTESPL